MVLQVCRNLLDDPQDVHDAFQAVFLVLARRGGAIRSRESVASWLYGVAVLKTMMLKKLTLVACALLPLGMIVFGGGAFVVQKSRAQAQARPAAASGQNCAPAAHSEPPKPPEADPLVQQLLEAARKRLQAQRAYYEAGRITIDRYVDACQQLEMIELKTADNDAERIAIRQRHLDRLKEIETREKVEQKRGQVSKADVAEATWNRMRAELDLKTSLTKSSDIDSLLRRLGELERRVEQLEKDRREKPAIR